MGRRRRDPAETTALVRWLLAELHRRNLSARRASLDAGLDHGAVTRYLSGTKPSPDACRQLADLFEVPAEYVLHLAGYVSPPLDEDLFLQQVAPLLGQLTPEDQELLLEWLHSVLRRRRREEQ